MLRPLVGMMFCLAIMGGLAPHAAAAPASDGGTSLDAVLKTRDASSLATRLGRVLGAATQCGLIDSNRIDNATVKAKALIRSAENSGDDEMALDDRMNDASTDGRDAVLDGDLECSVVDADLRSIEMQKTQ